MNRIAPRIVALLIAALAFAPATIAAKEEPSDIRVNVIACVDPDCANTLDIVTMVGATVSSLDASGAVIDSCMVTETPSGMVDCSLAPPTEGGSWQIAPAAAYAGYNLVSLDPTIFESEMHGAVYVWYFAPTAEVPTEQTPAPTQPVTGLPSTGVGSASSAGLLSIMPIALALLAIAATAIRGEQRS